ncbi:MAG: hypothetical protein WDO15_17370 [Bacteroidota bacterium]
MKLQHQTGRVNEILRGRRETIHETVKELTALYRSSYFNAAISNDHYSRYASISRYDLDQIRNFPGCIACG